MLSDKEFAINEAQTEEILDPTKWRMGKRGNPYRRYNDSTISVFLRYGVWKWCINYGDDDSVFSQNRYETEQEAKEALASYLVRGI